MTNIERAYFETNYSCASCGTRGMENLSIDHIEGRSGEDSSKFDNLIALCHNCHHRKTNGKGISLEQIKELKKNLIFNTLTPYGVNALKIAARNNFGVAATPFLLFHLVDMGLLKQEEEIMGYGNMKDRHISTEARFSITDEGKRIYERWLK